MDFEICLGFSGGKDSQVVYDLCKRSGVHFKAYYNRAFESPITTSFIRENYPDVIWRHDHHYGFIENIRKVHHGLLPTVQTAFCCNDYKHNPKYVDKCSIVGVRKAESRSRASRTSISVKNKTTLKKNKELIDSYFVENCQSIGTASVIQLLPIVDWTDVDVWDYIHAHNLPVNPEYQYQKRVGCIVCPKANFTSNVIGLYRYPKLVDAFILAREKGGLSIDWYIKQITKATSTISHITSVVGLITRSCHLLISNKNCITNGERFMTIETKFNIGDEVWVNYNGIPTQGKVKWIEVLCLDLLGTKIRYSVFSYEPPFSECLLFKTKQELLDSL